MAYSWSKTIAMYAASLLRQGNFVDAGFVAAILFERHIEDEMATHGIQATASGDFLFSAIEQLACLDPGRFRKHQLHQLRKIRNRYVIHTDDAFEGYKDAQERERIKKEVARLVTYVWQQLDPDRYHEYGSVAGIPLLAADYAVLAVREFFQDDSVEIEAEQCIERRDFHDLIHMRKHLLHLSGHLKRAVLPRYPNLGIDVISKADTTSGYVWLAINLLRPGWDNQRDRVRHASASIIATPLDLRLCISLGGEGYLPRKDWYRFLETPIFREFIAHTPGLQLLNVDWHCFITDRYDARTFVGSQTFRDELAEAKELLAICQKRKGVMTWERLQTGFIIERNRIEYPELCEKLETIIRLYYLFEKYRRDTLKRNNTLAWTPEGV